MGTTNPFILKYEQMRYDRVVARLQSWKASSIQLIGDTAVNDLVQLSEREKQEMMRPSTPPRPIATYRKQSPWREDEFQLEPNGFAATGERCQRANSSPQRANDASMETPGTPTKKTGQLFLSDHFGLFATFQSIDAA